MEEYFKDVYDKSAVLQDYLEEHKTWYGPKLLEALGIGSRRKRVAPVSVSSRASQQTSVAVQNLILRGAIG